LDRREIGLRRILNCLKLQDSGWLRNDRTWGFPTSCGTVNHWLECTGQAEAQVMSHQPNRIEDLKRGDHVGFFYETEDEHRSVITPFLRQGLENHEKVVYVVDMNPERTILDYLRDDGIEVEPYLVTGQLRILTSTDVYMQEEEFTPAGMQERLRRETQRALEEGYTALRGTSEMTWALRGYPGCHRLIEYESKIGPLISNHACICICQYDRRRFTAAVLLHVLATHALSIVGSSVRENPFYMATPDLLHDEPPQTVLCRCLDELSKRSTFSLSAT
jgi:hypothetical protein